MGRRERWTVGVVRDGGGGPTPAWWWRSGFRAKIRDMWKINLDWGNGSLLQPIQPQEVSTPFAYTEAPKLFQYHTIRPSLGHGNFLDNVTVVSRSPASVTFMPLDWLREQCITR
ncbi:Uncharacterized protein Fot_09688 [Forsythia ovata]|uniref:Uncharacterized protein n=1 Tax=Forsythia ovata TaxID=205694 RepID=A0ABD1WER0_9LAMI